MSTDDVPSRVPSSAPAEKTWILIPAYQPDDRLVALVRELLATSESTVLVVNDGSAAACASVFDALKTLPNTIVIEHAVNRGKGQALKTGIDYYLAHAPAGSPGLVTADADGQHLTTDILKVAQTGATRQAFTLGVRTFPETVPLRSRFGNILTKHIFHLFTGKKISDTQTGLRFIPRALLPRLLNLDYDRYEYELAMLIDVVNTRKPIVEVPITTVYLDGNKSSHFNPLFDSLSIYFVFLRFSGVSILTALLDYIVFAIAFFASSSILASMIVARFVAGIFNFTASRKWVFHASGKISKQLPRYVALVVLLMLVSWGLTEALYEVMGGYVLIAKALAEGALFITSFAIQRLFVFGEKEETE